MRQGHLTNMFQQTKHHSNAQQQHIPPAQENNADGVDSLSQFKKLNNNKGGVPLSSKSQQISQQNGFNSQLKNGQASRNRQGDRDMEFDSQSGQVQRREEREQSTPKKLNKQQAREGSISNHINNQQSVMKNSQAKNRSNRKNLDDSFDKPGHEVTTKQVVQYMASFQDLPTQASTLVTTKKRVQAPLSPVSDEYEKPIIPSHASKSTRAQRSKTRASRSKSKHNEEIMNVQRGDHVMAEHETSKKRKIQEISSTESQQDLPQQNIQNYQLLQDQELDLQNDQKRKRYNEEDLREHGIIPPTQQDKIKIQTTKKESTKKQSSTATNAKSILSNLSSTTQELMKKALINQKQTYPSTPKKSKSSAIKSVKEQDLAFEEVKVQDSPPQVKIPQLSQQTQAIINQVMNDQSLKTKNQITTFPASNNRTYQQIQKDEISMRLKHGQLLSVTKELVLPSHYKLLLDLQGHLDTSLNFIKRCRNQAGKFDELKKSIEQTFGRKFEINQFKQILTIAPDFYTYKWEQLSQYQQPYLTIDFNINEKNISQGFLDERHKIFRQRLFDYCRGYYDTFIQNLKKDPQYQQEYLDFDPYQEQMWYHLFDPHSVEPIPMTDIPQPQDSKLQQKRSESVKDFLNKSSIQSTLVQQALEKSVLINQQSQKTAADTQQSDKDLEQLKALSAKTGLSIETLRLIKAKENAIKQSQSIMNKSMVQQDGQKKLQQFSKLSEQIRLQMNFKNVSAMYLSDLVKTLNDSQRGNFHSTSEYNQMIDELSKLVPEWLTLKDVKGRLVKINKNIPTQQVQQWLQERINTTNQEEQKHNE